MYEIVLSVHSYVRWLALVGLLAVLIRSALGWFGGRAWQNGDDRLLRASTGLLGIQFILGLLLYLIWSPFTLATFGNFGVLSKDPIYRFFTIDHAVAMFVAVGLFNVGGAVSRKGATDAEYKGSRIPREFLQS